LCSVAAAVAVSLAALPQASDPSTRHGAAWRPGVVEAVRHARTRLV